MTEEPSAWSAYVAAVIRIEAPGGVYWVRPSPLTFTTGEYPDPEGRPIYVLTAHNPGGRVVSDTENASAEARLAVELGRRGLTWCPASGGDPSWTHVEPGVALIGVDQADAIALGAEFGQEAIFALTRTERRVVGCADKRVTATGWSIEREADEGAGPAVQVTVYTENFQVGGGSVTPKDYDGYIDWVSRHDGLLCRLRLDEGAIALHGDGQGRVLINGEWDGPRGPFSVTNALQQLSDADVFESVDEFDTGFWGEGDIATLVAPFKRQSEFVIDGGEWFSDDEWAYPAHPGDTGGLVLAESSWELEEDTGFSFSGEGGAEVLVRIGPRYVICSVNGSEQEHKTLEAVDDEGAVTAFKAAIGSHPSPA